MKLTKEDIKKITLFFGNTKLQDLFIELYNFQLESVPEIFLDIRKEIIGFRCKNELLRLYVGNNYDDSFYVKVKTAEKTLLAEWNMETIKKYLRSNDRKYAADPKKYFLANDNNLKHNQDENNEPDKRKTNDDSASDNSQDNGEIPTFTPNEPVQAVNDDLSEKNTKNTDEYTNEKDNLNDENSVMIDLTDSNVESGSYLIEEEQSNLDEIIKYLDENINRCKTTMPYPDVGEYDTGSDYEDIANIKAKQNANKPYYEKIKYYTDIKDKLLYIGHLKTDNFNYYLCDSDVQMKEIEKGIRFISVDDRNYTEILKYWNYPKKEHPIEFSRGIEMITGKILDVIVKFDRHNSIYSQISDRYLINALLKNKEKDGIESIISTIQEEQNEIREVDKSLSFIVQGCAGSGKTMVLLHRLRYLIYNKDINYSDYYFLTPGKQYNSFISDISQKFKISHDRIYTFNDYYKFLYPVTTKLKDFEFLDENVFPLDYLNQIYSKDFMAYIYGSLVDYMVDISNNVIDICENKLNCAIEQEQNKINEEAENELKVLYSDFKKCVEPVEKHLKNNITDISDNFKDIIFEIDTAYISAKKNFEEEKTKIASINISEEIITEKINKNDDILRMKEDVKNEEDRLKNSSIFTKLAHKNKLKKLNDLLTAEIEKARQSAIDEEKKKAEGQLYKNRVVWDNLSFDKVESIINELNDIAYKITSSKTTREQNISNIENIIEKKFMFEGNALNDFIEISSDIRIKMQEYVDNFNCSWPYLENVITKGKQLFNLFSILVKNDKDFKKLKENTKLFTQKTDSETQAYLYTFLFNKCKKAIKNDFDIEICNKYKHYWYLSLYCSYFVRGGGKNRAKYIFIDEAQDLSFMEIELIKKYNTFKNDWGEVQTPVMNLFGDNKQVITKHGVSNWNTIKGIDKVYNLNENFRNTNQIVKYCNDELNLKMQPVGVNSDEVKIYDSIDELFNKLNLSGEYIYIVKDEYAKDDLVFALNQHKLKHYKIYTVKDVKGLEFKEIFVFDRYMTENEKYIAYTRTLNKLNVVKDLPEYIENKVTKIIQGDEET